jgi:hypothetical protein
MRDALLDALYSLAMQGNTGWAGEEIMVNVNRQSAFSGSFFATSIAMAAGLLILLGIVLQLGELGYGHINPSNFWVITMITQGAWNLLALHTNTPALEDVLRFWPLALVSVGTGILMLRMERL